MMSKLVATLLLYILLTGLTFAQRPDAQDYVSPDGTLRVKVVPVGKSGYEQYEARVEIRSTRGQLLFTKSLASPDGEHGESVGHAAWTPDSLFFVFNTFSSGGHQPWRHPVYFYSRRDNRLGRLDDYIGPIVGDFELRPPGFIKTRKLRQGEIYEHDSGVQVIVNLSKVKRSAHLR